MGGMELMPQATSTCGRINKPQRVVSPRNLCNAVVQNLLKECMVEASLETRAPVGSKQVPSTGLGISGWPFCNRSHAQ